MPFVATDYSTNPKAPWGKWVCTRTSDLGPFDDVPEFAKRHGPDFCGQCVSFVTTVCADIPVNTMKWVKGMAAKGNADIKPGTAIATFDTQNHYLGHAAVYVSQDGHALQVVDQWVTGSGSAIGTRPLRFGAHGVANDGNGFFVVE